MGSLTPGWDAEHGGVPPKELQDTGIEQDETAVKGYFKKLEERKMAKQSSLGRSSLSRMSAEAHPPTLAEAASFKNICPPVLDDDSHTATAHIKVQPHPPMAHSASAGQAKYQFTDWGSELQTLGRKSYEHAKPVIPENKEVDHSSSWWSHMDSARMLPADNVIREVEEEGPPHRAQGSFKPQNLTPSTLNGLLHTEQQS